MSSFSGMKFVFFFKGEVQEGCAFGVAGGSRGGGGAKMGFFQGFVFFEKNEIKKVLKLIGKKPKIE